MVAFIILRLPVCPESIPPWWWKNKQTNKQARWLCPWREQSACHRCVCGLFRGDWHGTRCVIEWEGLASIMGASFPISWGPARSTKVEEGWVLVLCLQKLESFSNLDPECQDSCSPVSKTAMLSQGARRGPSGLQPWLRAPSLASLGSEISRLGLSSRADPGSGPL